MQPTKTAQVTHELIQAQYPGAKIDDAVCKLPKDFQCLVDQFVGGIQFRTLISASSLDDDQFLYEFESVAGDRYYILEIDYVTGFHAIEMQMRQLLGENIRFIEVQSPPENFFDCPPSKFFVGKNPIPESFDVTKQYFNCKCGSEEYYFSFLMKVSL